MIKYGVKTDPCEECKTPFKKMKSLSIREKVAGSVLTSIYSSHYICPECESIYVCYDDDYERFGHQKRYKVSHETRIELLKKVRYKEWISVGKPTTEYGMFRKHGISQMHNPFNGHLYALIEKAFQQNRFSDIKKLEQVYPEKVKSVREFII